MERKLEVIEGGDDPGPIGRIVRLGEFTVGITKKSIKLGFGIAAEIGDMLMYASGQRHYARELEAREPGDRAARELKTALRAFDQVVEGKGYKPEELSTYAALDFAAANHKLQEIDPDMAIENTPAVVTLIEKIPDTHVGARVAEQVVADGLAPIVDDFNTRVRPIPTQREPSD